MERRNLLNDDPEGRGRAHEMYFMTLPSCKKCWLSSGRHRCPAFSCRKETLEHEYHRDLSGRIQVTKERGRDKLSGPSSSSRVQ